nr:E-beta-farnesene synthase [Tanacetum cinerariifolium]
MDDVNVNAPAGQAPTMAPPMLTDDQILPHIRWVPIGKRNCYLDVEKSQRNPIYKIAVDILKHTNFFRAFTTSSTIPSIYIQKLWDTIQYDKSAGCYRCQLDEQWFDLTKDTLKDTLQITPVNENQAFTSSPSSDALINFVNELGYPKLVRNLSNVPVLIMLRGSGKNSPNPSTHSLMTKGIWHSILTGKNKATLIVISSIRFTKQIIYHLRRKHKFHPRPDSSLHLPNEEPVLGYLKFSAKGRKREVFGMPIPGSLITADIQEASYYQEYLAKVAKHQRYLAGETRSDLDSPTPKPTKTARNPKPTAPKADPRPPVSKPVSSKQPEPKSAPAKTQGKKRKLTTEISDKPSKAIKSRTGFVSKKRKPISTLRSVDESVAEDVPEKEPHVDDEEADVQRALEEILKSMRTSTPTRSSGHDESSSLYAELGSTDSEEESEEDVSGADAGVQGEGQAGPDLGAQDEGRAGSNSDEQAEGKAGPDPGNVEASQPMPSPVVHAGSDREHMDLDVADVSTQPPPEQMDEGYKPSEADNDKVTAETEVESMMFVTIQQDMSSIPPMTTPIIDLTSRLESPKVHQLLKATAIETTTTTTTILLPPSQQQQSTTDAMMMKRIGELEHIMANLIQENKRLEKRLDNHGARLYTLEQLDIPHQVNRAVDKVVTDAVDWAMQAPLRSRFRDLPEADMKEIIHQRMWETDSYKTHEDHMQLYEAPEKSMNRDHSEELAKDLDEARKKKKKSRDSPKTPPGSPPPPPLPAGPSEASGSSQVPPPPSPPPSTNQEGQSNGSSTPSSSKTVASAEYQAWTTIDIRLKPSISLTPADLQMDDDMAPDEQ